MKAQEHINDSSQAGHSRILVPPKRITLSADLRLNFELFITMQTFEAKTGLT